MLHKGFFGAEKGVFLAPQTLRSKKFRLRRQKSRLRRNLFDFEGKRREKTGTFYDANKRNQEKTPLKCWRGGKNSVGRPTPCLIFCWAIPGLTSSRLRSLKLGYMGRPCGSRTTQDSLQSSR